jgi:NAD(P)-dependent dehydrogenase (short-subunit alcohol dehydrogenase family)
MGDRTQGPPVAAITGSDKGIGRAVATRFAQSGHQLALCDQREPDRADLDELARTSGLRPLFFRRDLAQPGTAQQFIDQAVETFGGIDVLITCAGILRFGPSDAVTPDDWSTVLAVNLTGTFDCIKAALPGMVHQGSGRIITISSELGLSGMPKYAAYCASKGGVIALTKALAREYAGRGILVNSVAPGPVLTDLLMDSPEYEPSVSPAIPIGRFAQPAEIAAMVHALAGDAGTFLVGQVISPNGGAVM